MEVSKCEIICLCSFQNALIYSTIIIKLYYMISLMGFPSYSPLYGFNQILRFKISGAKPSVLGLEFKLLMYEVRGSGLSLKFKVYLILVSSFSQVQSCRLWSDSGQNVT